MKPTLLTFWMFFENWNFWTPRVQTKLYIQKWCLFLNSASKSKSRYQISSKLVNIWKFSKISMGHPIDPISSKSLQIIFNYHIPSLLVLINPKIKEKIFDQNDPIGFFPNPTWATGPNCSIFILDFGIDMGYIWTKFHTWISIVI